MFLRAGTTAIHCFASGLAGLGWQAILAERSWLRGLAFGALAVLVHGAWNVLALGQGAALLGEGGLDRGVVLALTAVVLGLMVLLWLAAVAGVPAIAARVAAQTPVQTAAAPDVAPGPAWPAGDEDGPAPANPDLAGEASAQDDVLNSP